MTVRKYVGFAMDAHTNLNVFSAIEDMLTIVSGDNKSASRIIKICRAEQQRQLKLMDCAVDKACDVERGFSYD